MQHLDARKIQQYTYLVGRWQIINWLNSTALYTTSLGSALRFSVRGTKRIVLTTSNNANPLSPSQYYAYRIDDQEWRRWPAKQNQLSITVSPLNHQINIMTGGNCDLDDVWFQKQGFSIQQLSIDDHATIEPLKREQQVLILGDSITAGCWVNGKHASVDYRPETNYVGIAQDLLSNIELHRVAYSAAGVLRPATGNVPVAKKWLDHLNFNISVSPKKYDLVVIALGVNDRRFPTSDFISAYQNYVNQVHRRYQCPVALMIPFLQSYRSEIIAIAQKTQCEWIDTKNWCPSTVDGLHPDQKGSDEAGKHFAVAISKLLKRM